MMVDSLNIQKIPAEDMDLDGVRICTVKEGSRVVEIWLEKEGRRYGIRTAASFVSFLEVFEAPLPPYESRDTKELCEKSTPQV